MCFYGTTDAIAIFWKFFQHLIFDLLMQLISFISQLSSMSLDWDSCTRDIIVISFLELETGMDCTQASR